MTVRDGRLHQAQHAFGVDQGAAVATEILQADLAAEPIGRPDEQGRGAQMETSRMLAAKMLRVKNIHPNLDFPAGPAYYLMGFDIPLFTPIFVASRITGWAAHVIEQAADNRLIRPRAEYVGPQQRHYVPMRER